MELLEYHTSKLYKKYSTWENVLSYIPPLRLTDLFCAQGIKTSFFYKPWRGYFSGNRTGLLVLCFTLVTRTGCNVTFLTVIQKLFWWESSDSVFEEKESCDPVSLLTVSSAACWLYTANVVLKKTCYALITSKKDKVVIWPYLTFAGGEIWIRSCFSLGRE